MEITKDIIQNAKALRNAVQAGNINVPALISFLGKVEAISTLPEPKKKRFDFDQSLNQRKTKRA